jgi:hypothetical protein
LSPELNVELTANCRQSAFEFSQTQTNGLYLPDELSNCANVNAVFGGATGTASFVGAAETPAQNVKGLQSRSVCQSHL